MHTKLCKIIKQLALIVSAAILLCTPICAISSENKYDFNLLMNQNFVYGQYHNGMQCFVNTSSASYMEYMYPVGWSQDTNYQYDETAIIYAQYGTGLPYSVQYLYIPIYTSVGRSLEYQIVVGTKGSKNLNHMVVTSVDTITDGVVTPAKYNNNDTGNYKTFRLNAGTESSGQLWQIMRLSVSPTVDTADIIRISFAQQSSHGDLMFGLYNLNVIGATTDLTEIQQTISNEMSNISNKISSVITQIQTSNSAIITAINDNATSTSSSITSLINTTIKYGDDANYYLDAITYSTDGQQLQVQSLRQNFASALQAIQAQNQIIHNNVINNAPTENQVNQVISKDQIAPDVDVSIIGGGSSNSGIGIIMSQTRIIAMLTCCIGIAILSYLLFGRKT